MSHLVVTGANGFVGRAVCKLALSQGHTVTGLVRQPGGCVDGVREWVHSAPDFDGLADAWPADVEPDCVIHLAARVHVMHEDAIDPQVAFDATNVDGALRVADAARRHGARRMVFVSSVKAIAERDNGAPLREDVTACPEDPYGRSKLKAEQALVRLAAANGLDVVIVRPPLVYGPDVRANFLRLMDAVWRRAPLPFGAVSARRSVLYVDNLADALLCCAIDPRAAGGTFHVADDDAPSVSELLRMVGEALGRGAFLVPVPTVLLQTLGLMTGRAPQVSRLTGGLCVDTSRIQEVVDWRPPYTTREGLAATAAWYRSRQLR
ncbi:NAD-dependent epimerase/dehydratase family protein [Paraburkholderia sp. A3RO-2L]|uniref:NAD-dependent epimerase/dehydratase family protein n=1 Tax=Paraburkholderia sp. A3RO-2L TaxID=3028376 RepID=UPI003DAA122A